MKPNVLYSILIGSVLLLTASGCKRGPTPVVNPPGVETSLASTALALAKQTEAASSFTATPPPTVTPTPTPRISINGTSLEVREDQSALFTDYKLGYQLSVPTGWLPVRINEEEYYKAFTLDAVMNNPSIMDFLTKLPTQNSETIRLTAVDVRPPESAGGLISGITVILQPETADTLEEWARFHPARANKRQGYQLLSSQYKETASGIKMLIREEQWNSSTKEKVYGRRIFFLLPGGILSMYFETAFDSKDAFIPEFEQVIDSITLLNPQ